MKTRVLRVMTGRHGGVLGVILVVMLAVTLIGLGLLTLSDSVSLSVAREVRDARAFWAAEAGQGHVKALLRHDAVFRDAPCTVVGTEPPYRATVVSNAATGLFTVWSTGTVGGASCVVTRDLLVRVGWPAAFDYSLFGGANAMDIAKDGLISDGPIFQNGDISLAGGSRVTNGEIVATGSVTPGYPVGEMPDPQPLMPPFDPTFYSNLILTARSGGGTWTNPATLVLGGGTNYFRQTNPYANLNGTITGPGAVVFDGDVTVDKDLTLGNHVKVVVGGEFKIQMGVSCGIDTLFYAGGGFTLDKANLQLGDCAMVTPGNINAKKQFTMNGIMYAGGTINIDMESTLTGCAIAGQGFTLKKTLHVTYSREQFPDPMIPGFAMETNIYELYWREVFK